jgi:hypothetical protein
MKFRCRDRVSANTGGIISSFRSPALVLLFMIYGIVSAFPPAPYYTLYGMVRDQVGQTITADGAEVILLKGTNVVGRASIISGNRLEQNYEIKIRIDQNRSGTSLYTENAIAAQGPYNIAVEIGGLRYYPIEVGGNLTAGKGGERIRLDLNLGADSDGDGLPDVWEQWQLYQAGLYPDENGQWQINLINRDGDYDNDGLTNWSEYVAGTFAGDATERFALEITDKNEFHTRFAFFAITGKTYTIEKSLDLVSWTRIPFSVGSFTAGQPAWTANDVAIVSAFTLPETAEKVFYRLSVR